MDRYCQVEKARHVLLLREKLSEQDRTVELSKLDKDALNKYRRLTATCTLLSDKERERSSTEMEKSTDDLDIHLNTFTDPSTALIVKCLKLMLNNRRETRARLLAEVIVVLCSFIYCFLNFFIIICAIFYILIDCLIDVIAGCGWGLIPLGVLNPPYLDLFIYVGGDIMTPIHMSPCTIYCFIFCLSLATSFVSSFSHQSVHGGMVLFAT